MSNFASYKIVSKVFFEAIGKAQIPMPKQRIYFDLLGDFTFLLMGKSGVLSH